VYHELFTSFVMLVKRTTQRMTKSRVLRSALRLLSLAVTYKTAIDQRVN